MKKLKVEWYKTGYGLAEVSQSSGFLFSFLSAPKDGNMQTMQWVKCRDFLHDAVKVRITGKDMCVYGFNCTKDNPKVDMRKMRMLVTRNGMKNGINKEDIDAFEKKIFNGLKIVNNFEELMNIGYTKVHRVADKEVVAWVFIGPSHWMKSPFLVSMYTFLIRLGNKEIQFDNHSSLIKKFKEISISNKWTNNHDDRDVGYLRTITDKITTIAKHNREIFGIGPGKIDRSYRTDVGIRNFHNNSGILSLCKYIETHKDVIERLVNIEILMNTERMDAKNQN